MTKVKKGNEASKNTGAGMAGMSCSRYCGPAQLTPCQGASAARKVPKFLDETTAKARKMHAQTDPATTPKATRLPCRRTLVNHLQLAAAAKNCFQCLGLVAAYTRSLLPGLREQ